MAIIFQKDKRTGITYAYDNKPYWDKEKKQSRAKRKLIGKVDLDTGKIVPTRAYRNRAKEEITPAIKPGPIPATSIRRFFYGATYLFDEIGEKVGLTADLKSCFPNNWQQIQSLAYFLILEENNAMSRFPKWDHLHKHPYGQCIPSQRSSELFQSIDEESKTNFFQKQGKRRAEKEYWAYDITSISSYSEVLNQVKWGKNKENDRLPQLNLALLFGEESNLPFYYRELPGNISDVKTVKHLLSEMQLLGYNKVNLVMDRGFYSKENINGLFQNHVKFLIGTKTSLKYVNEKLEESKNDLQSWLNYNEKHEIYCVSHRILWDYEQKRPYKGDIIKEKKRCYLHLYFNSEKASNDAKKMNRYLTQLKNELESKQERLEHQKDYQKYFTVKETPVRGRTVVPNNDAIKKAAENYGYFTLLSNEVKDPIIALDLYRNKDLIEKAFGNLKERLNFRRTLVSSESSLNGKLFVEFIALIYLSYIKKQMQDQNLFSQWTLQGLLDEIDVIERFEAPGRSPTLGEVTKKQSAIYVAMDVEPPSL